MRESPKLIILVFALLYPLSPIFAAESKTSSSKVSSADTAFAKDAAVGGLMEVDLGKLAQTKASNEKVKEYGKRMEQDHSKSNKELTKIASDKGISLPRDLDTAHKSKADKISKLSGADFDREYMQGMVNDHKEVIKKFQQQSEKGSDPDLRKFAGETLATLKEHLQQAESIAANLKSSSKGTK